MQGPVPLCPAKPANPETAGSYPKLCKASDRRRKYDGLSRVHCKGNRHGSSEELISKSWVCCLTYLDMSGTNMTRPQYNLGNAKKTNTVKLAMVLGGQWPRSRP